MSWDEQARIVHHKLYKKMSKHQVTEHQLQLWQQIGSLFQEGTGWAGSTAPASSPGVQSLESPAPLMPEEESGVDEASAVADAAGSLDEPGSAEPDPGPRDAPLTQPSNTSATREETIRMIGEAIDVQTDFPGFDEVEKPSYLSEDLHHLLKKEETEESLETMTEDGFTPPWHKPEQAGQSSSGTAMPLPDDLTRDDREGQGPVPQESQDLGQLNPPLQQEQAPEQVDVPPAEANQAYGQVEPNLEEEKMEAAPTEPALDRQPNLQDEEPSPRAFPQNAQETAAPSQSGLSDIMRRATMQALRSAREAAARQGAPPANDPGIHADQQPAEANPHLEPEPAQDFSGEPQDQGESGDFLHDPQDPDPQNQPSQQDDSQDDPPSSNPFQSAPWGG